MLPGPVVQTDPGLVPRQARRRVRDGPLQRGGGGFRQAEELLDEPEFRRRCVASGGGGACGSPAPAVRRPRTQARARAGGASRLSRELRRLATRYRPPTGTADHRSGARLRLALAGEPPAAIEPRRVRAQSPTPVPARESLAIRLVAQLADLERHRRRLGRSAGAGGAGRGRRRTALDRRRVARGLQAASLLAAQPGAWRLGAATDLRRRVRAQGDRWAAVLRLRRPVRRTWRTGTDGAASRLLTRSGAAVRRARRAACSPLAAGALRGHPPTRRDARQRDGRAGVGSPAAPRSRPDTAGGCRLAARPITPSRDPVPPGRRAAVPAALPRAASSWTVDGVGGDLASLRPRAGRCSMLLALHAGRDVHRETLIDALWPGARRRPGPGSLQVAVSSVRQCWRRPGCADTRCSGEVTPTPSGSPRRRTTCAELETTCGRRRHAPSEGDLERPAPAGRARRVHRRPAARRRAGRVGLAERDRIATGCRPRAPRPRNWPRPRSAAALAAARRSVDLDRYHDPAWRCSPT